VDSDAAAGILGEASLQKPAPIVDHGLRRGAPVVERPIQDGNSLLFENGDVVGGIANFHHDFGIRGLESIYKLRERFVRGPVDDQEPHVAEGDFRGRWMWRHVENGREVSGLSIRYAFDVVAFVAVAAFAFIVVSQPLEKLEEQIRLDVVVVVEVVSTRSSYGRKRRSIDFE